MGERRSNDGLGGRGVEAERLPRRARLFLLLMELAGTLSSRLSILFVLRARRRHASGVGWRWAWRRDEPLLQTVIRGNDHGRVRILLPLHSLQSLPASLLDSPWKVPRTRTWTSHEFQAVLLRDLADVHLLRRRMRRRRASEEVRGLGGRRKRGGVLSLGLSEDVERIQLGRHRLQ